MDVAKPMIQPEKAKQPKQQLANGPQLGSVQYKTWTQNQLTHPDGVEFIEPGKESPRRVFKFSTGSLEKSSSKKFADWGETTEDKLMQALSVAAVDLVETTFAGGVLSGEAMTEHGDCTFSAEFRNDQTEVFILIKPAND
jgi:hypothetical protein